MDLGGAPIASTGSRNASGVQGSGDGRERRRTGSANFGDDRGEVSSPAGGAILTSLEGCSTAGDAVDDEVAAVAPELDASNLARDLQCFPGPLGHHAGFKLRDAEHLAEHELADRSFGVRKIAELDLDLRRHQRTHEVGVTGQPAHVRDDELGVHHSAECQGLSQFRAYALVRAGLDLGEAPDNGPVSAVQPIADGLFLGLQAETAPTLLARRDPVVADVSSARHRRSARLTSEDSFVSSNVIPLNHVIKGYFQY